MTRKPITQALQDKNGKPAKTEKGLFICPTCRHNGMSGTLVPYP